jgi:hypothetical protein
VQRLRGGALQGQEPAAAAAAAARVRAVSGRARLMLQACSRTTAVLLRSFSYSVCRQLVLLLIVSGLD